MFPFYTEIKRYEIDMYNSVLIYRVRIFWKKM